VLKCQVQYLVPVPVPAIDHVTCTSGSPYDDESESLDLKRSRSLGTFKRHRLRAIASS
jgi:hypothetical protein